MQTERLDFENESGQRLAARLDLPVDGVVMAYALFAHCFTCGKNLKAATRISRALTARGIAVLRFDFTGLGESEGDFADTDFSSNVDDLVAAAGYLEQEHQAPQILLGHSLGGAAVLQAAHRLPEVRAVATVAAPAEPGHVLAMLEGSRETIEQQGSAEVSLAGRRFRIGRRFLEDLDGEHMEREIRDLRKPLLVLHAPLDRQVDVDNATRIFGQAKHPKSFVSLDRADHLLSDPRDAEYAGTVIAAWASKYLDVPREQRRRPDPADNRVVVQTGASGYRSEILANGHPLVADEPESVGGTNTGPGPYELLLAGLGACTGMTLRMYADRKSWPLEGVTVELAHRKVHVSDCLDCETAEGKVDEIQRELRLAGPLDAEQRQRLLEIADRCPVHRTLESEIKVRTRLADPEETGDERD